MGRISTEDDALAGGGTGRVGGSGRGILEAFFCRVRADFFYLIEKLIEFFDELEREREGVAIVITFLL